MFEFLKNVFLGKPVDPQADGQAQPEFDTATSVAPAPAAARPPVENASHSRLRSAPAANGNGGSIDISLQAVLSGFPLELKGRIMQSDVGAATVSLPVEKVLSQLALGAVKITFGELRRAAPQLFAPGSDRDQVQVGLPLNEILGQIDPMLLPRRANQRQIEIIPDEVRSPFGDRGNGLIFSVGPSNKTETPASSARSVTPATPPPRTPAAPPRSVTPAPSVQSAPMPPPRPLAPQAPVQPAKPSFPNLPPIPAAPGRGSISSVPPVAKPAATPSPPIPFAPTTRNSAAGPITPIAPIRPIAPSAPPVTPVPIARSAPAPITPIIRATPIAPITPIAPSAPRPPVAAREAVPQSAPAAPEVPSLSVPLMAIAESWPEAIRHEIVQSRLIDAKVALPVELVGQALKRGKVAFTWKVLRSWIRPQPLSTVSTQDNAGLELPLKVLAPLFLNHQQNAGRSQQKVAIDENIPNLFFGFPQPGASGAPATSEAPAPAPAPAPASRPVTKSSDTNYFSVEDNTDSPRATETELKRRSVSPGTNFVTRCATPNEVVSRAAALDGVAGALIALPDGLMVASRLASDLNGDTLAAFLPQIFSKVSQCTKELRMGELNNLNFTVGNVPWKIFRVNAIFFAAFGRPGQPLPTAQLVALASELDRKKQ